MLNKNRISDKVKRKFRDSIRNIVDDLSRNVVVYKQSIKYDCNNCFFDKLTFSSTNKCKWTPVQALAKQAEWESEGNSTIRYKYFVAGRCPVCKGLGYLETIRRRSISCLVTWNPSSNSASGNSITYTPAGTEGSTIVRLKTDPKHYDLFKNCYKIVVDGIECKLSTSPILRGLGNQSILIIWAFTTEKPDIDSKEIIKDYT